MIFSIAGAISKILGGIYRISLARLIGDEGMALYQMAYPIYAVHSYMATIIAIGAGAVIYGAILLVLKEINQDLFNLLRKS